MQRRRVFRFALAALASAALLSAPSSSWAQSPQPTDADKATARELGADGQAALDKKDYKTAEDRFHRADQIFHAPTLALGLARAQTGNGKLLEAQETYNRIIREGAAPGAPAAFAAAVADARREVDGVASRLASIVISVSGADDPKVTLDDQPVPTAVLGVKRPVNPGVHLVKATAQGYKSAQQSVTVDEKGAVTATLALERDPNAPLTPPPGAAGTEGQPGAGPAAGGPGAGGNGAPPAGGDTSGGAGHGSAQKTAAFVALGVGAVGLVVGGITGAIALADHGKIADKCTNGTCPASEQSNVDTYHTMGTLSTVGFIVGGVGVAAGVVLLLTAPKASASAQAASAKAPTTERFIRPYAGLGTVGAYGRF